MKVTIFTIYHPWFIKINNLTLQAWNEVVFLWFIYGKLCIYIVHTDPAAFGALFPQIYDAAAVSYNWLSMFGTLKRPKKMRYLQISTIRYPELEKKNLKNEHIIVFLLLNLNMRLDKKEFGSFEIRNLVRNITWNTTRNIFVILVT